MSSPASKSAPVPAKVPLRRSGAPSGTSFPAAAAAAGQRRSGAPLAPSPEGMQDFLNVLRRRALPAQISDESLPRVQEMLLHCIMDCYRDRVKPVQSVVQRRLRENRGGEAIAQALLPLCAREPDRYRIVPPMHGEQPVVLLMNEPPWFAGWFDCESPETNNDLWPTGLSGVAWQGLRQFLSDSANCLPVQPHEAALQLHQQNLPFLQNHSVTDIESIVRSCLARQWLTDGGPENCLRPAGCTLNSGETNAKAGTNNANAEVEATSPAETGCEASAEADAKKDEDSLKHDSDMGEDQDDVAVGLLKLMQRFPDGITLSLLKKHHIETRCGHDLSEEAFSCTTLAKVFNLPQRT